MLSSPSNVSGSIDGSKPNHKNNSRNETIEDDGEFKVVYLENESYSPDSTKQMNSLSDDEFIVDLQMEQDHIFQIYEGFSDKQKFNLLNIDKTNVLDQCGFFKKNKKYTKSTNSLDIDLSNLYSSRYQHQMLIINMENIWLANTETQCITQEMKRKDVSQVNILPYSVSVVGKAVNKSLHNEMIILDRIKFTNIAEYMKLFWANLIVTPITKNL